MELEKSYRVHTRIKEYIRQAAWYVKLPPDIKKKIEKAPTISLEVIPDKENLALLRIIRAGSTEIRVNGFSRKWQIEITEIK